MWTGLQTSENTPRQNFSCRGVKLSKKRCFFDAGDYASFSARASRARSLREKCFFRRACRRKKQIGISFAACERRNSARLFSSRYPRTEKFSVRGVNISSLTLLRFLLALAALYDKIHQR